MSKYKFIKVSSPLVYSTLQNKIDTAISIIRKNNINNDVIWIFEVSRSLAALGAPTIYYRVTEELFNHLKVAFPTLTAGRCGKHKRCSEKF